MKERDKMVEISSDGHVREMVENREKYRRVQPNDLARAKRVSEKKVKKLGNQESLLHVRLI